MKRVVWCMGAVLVSLGLAHCKGSDGGSMNGDGDGAGATAGAGAGTGDGDGDVDPVVLAKAGSRLQALFWEAEGGAHVFRTFVDQETDKACTFLITGQDDEGDTYHCVSNAYAQEYFSDTGCEESILQLVGNSCNPVEPGDIVSATRSSGDGCGSSQVYFEVGPEIETPSLVYSINYITGTCDASLVAEGQVFVEALPADWSGHVAGRRRFQLLDAESRLGALVIEGSDGSSYVQGAAIEGKSCTRVDSPDADESYCLPGGIIQSHPSYRVDAACEGEHVAVAYVPRGCGDDPDFVVKRDVTNGCNRVESIHILGEELEQAYDGQGEDCTERIRTESQQFWTLGARVPQSEMVRVGIENVGTGRLVAKEASFEGHVLGSINTWYDTELEVSCSPRSMGDELGMRCIPWQRSVSGGSFLDSACTVPAYSSSTVRCEDNRVLDLLVEEEILACGSRFLGVRELVPHEGPIYWDPGTGCEEREAGEIRIWFAAGEEVPLTQFAAMEQITR